MVPKDLETDLKYESYAGPFFSKTKRCTILNDISFESPKHKLSKMVKQIFLHCLETRAGTGSNFRVSGFAGSGFARTGFFGF